AGAIFRSRAQFLPRVNRTGRLFGSSGASKSAPRASRVTPPPPPPPVPRNQSIVARRLAHLPCVRKSASAAGEPRRFSPDHSFFSPTPHVQRPRRKTASAATHVPGVGQGRR
ncbi:unnamed protein product, partial [Ixodes pacificus]